MEAKRLYFENVNIMDEINPIVKEMTLVGNVMYAAATWDLHRVHYDGQYAQKHGFPGPFVDGQLFGSYFTQMVTEYFGPDCTLKKLGMTYKLMAFPGDILTCKGVVEKKYKENNHNLVECKCWIENQNMKKIIELAWVIVGLPSLNEASD